MTIPDSSRRAFDRVRQTPSQLSITGTLAVPPAAGRLLPSATARIAVALAVAAAAVALSVWTAPYIPRTVFVIAFAAVVVAAWYGGAWAGLLTSAVCVLGVDWFLIPPTHTITPADPADYVPMAAFVVVSSLIGTMADSLRRARDVARVAAGELEEANRQLQEQAVELEMTNQQLQDQTVELELANEELEARSEELARRTEEAERAERAAEEANLAKSEFLATMSHELRTPLNAIAGYVQLIEMGVRGPVTPEQREDLARIGRSQRQLMGLITEVLDFAKIEAGSVAYHLEPVAVDRVLADIEALVRPQVALKRLEYADGGGRCGEVVLADRQRVEQILLNLLSNAIKFTPAGGRIEVTCDGDASTVALRVRDTGIGIPREKLDAVFQPFVQLSSGFTRTSDGTGLGLAISRDLARGMGGELRAESEPGKGSTFTLTLPREGGSRL